MHRAAKAISHAKTFAARRPDSGRGLLQRAAHRVEHRLNHAKRQRKGNEDVSQDDRTGGEHRLNSVRCEKAAKNAVRPPQQQQCEAGDGGWNRCRQRDCYDQCVPSPKVVTGQHVSCE